MSEYNFTFDWNRISTLGKVKVLVEQVVGSPSQEAINTAVAQYISEHPGSLAPLSPAVKSALLQIAEKVAYVDENGQDYYNALDAALSAKALLQITAVYTQSGTVYDTDSLDSLKADLVVTAYYDDSTTADVTALCTLSGTLTEGTSTITVTYVGKTDTFNVNVTDAPPLYVLPAQTTFTGSQKIDTGVKLLLTDTDYTITMSYLTGSPPSSGYQYLLHCMNESGGYYGMTWVVSKTLNYYTLVGPMTSPYPQTAIPIESGHTVKVVLRHIAAQNLYLIDSVVDGVTQTQVTGVTTKTIESVDRTLKIGAQYNSSNAYAKYWKGTLYDLTVYGVAKSDAFVADYFEE